MRLPALHKVLAVNPSLKLRPAFLGAVGFLNLRPPSLTST